MRSNKYPGRKRKLFASTMLILRLLFGGLQSASASSNSKTFQSGVNSKTEISRTLNQQSSMINNFNPEGSTQPELVPEDSQLLLTLGLPRGGEWQPKFGPGARAKADARRNAKGSGSSIIPGASGYTPQHTYRIYKESGRLPAPQTKIEAGVSNFNDGVPPRIAPSVSPNRQGRIKSEPLRIKSEHQKTDVIVTKKDVKKWITPEQRKETSNQKINEQRVEEKFVGTVKKPNEVLDGIHIHREQKNCKVYIKDIETIDGTQKKSALIADTETGRSYLGSTLTEQEYSNLKKTGEIDLSDLRRDPQTLVMNQKSIQEAEALSRAKDEGCLTEFTDIRRPYNVSESLADFVGKDSMGSKINIDIKAIDGSGRRPIDRQTQDINQNIKNLFDGADDPTKFHIIYDISVLPSFLKDVVIKNITQGLASNQLDNISFLLD